MLVKINSVGFTGITPVKVTVEINVASRGIPSFEIVGLPHKTIDESRYRVKAAIVNSGFEFPNKKITVNLAPADLSKHGSFYDFPIAAGILFSQLNLNLLEDSILFGELSLDGSLRHTKGALLTSLLARELNIPYIFVPNDCAREAASLGDVKVFGVNSLADFVKHVRRETLLSQIDNTQNTQALPSNEFVHNSVITSVSKTISLNEISGQEQAKRAIQICAAGNHNLLMAGPPPPGSGKTMLANALCSLLPTPSREESIDITKAYSYVGLVPPGGGLISTRPFRSPHHTVSYAGMIGGGSTPIPGEASLAHRGLLFMDEFSEFSRSVIEALRQPLEDGVVTISRSQGTCTYPSKFLLVAASNPCPCGYLGHENVACTCTVRNIQKYRSKLSGPIIDRIDLYVDVFSVRNFKLSQYLESCEDNKLPQIVESISHARDIQLNRFEGFKIFSNSEMNNKQVKEFCPINPKAELLLDRAVSKLHLSARGYFKTIKVARTIADIDGSDAITTKHIAEALQFRNR